MIVGASLGLVYAPCAGPILAGVIVVSAAQDFTAGRLAVALSYAIGSAIVLYLLLLGGRRLTQRLKPDSGARADGDGRGDGPGRDRDDGQLGRPLPDRDRQRSAEVPRQSDGEHREEQGDLDRAGEGEPGTASRWSPPTSSTSRSSLPTYGQAPDFTGTQDWFNTPGGSRSR